MVSNMTTKVLNSQRDIAVRNKTEVDDEQIRVVSTFKADDNIVASIKNSEEGFKQTPSFRNVKGKLFKFVKKIGPNIKSRVNNLKKQALGMKKGGVRKCRGHGCKCCKMLNSAASTRVNNQKIRRQVVLAKHTT